MDANARLPVRASSAGPAAGSQKRLCLKKRSLVCEHAPWAGRSTSWGWCSGTPRAPACRWAHCNSKLLRWRLQLHTLPAAVSLDLLPSTGSLRAYPTAAPTCSC